MKRCTNPRMIASAITKGPTAKARAASAVVGASNRATNSGATPTKTSAAKLQLSDSTANGQPNGASAMMRVGRKFSIHRGASNAVIHLKAVR